MEINSSKYVLFHAKHKAISMLMPVNASVLEIISDIVRSKFNLTHLNAPEKYMSTHAHLRYACLLLNVVE